jgi:microtubule-associated protein-like 6
VRKGPFQAGASANFNGKILYRHCRKPVYTPSDWDPAVADRSSDLPMARLVLEFIYGYQGQENTGQNLFYTAEGKLVRWACCREPADAALATQANNPELLLPVL